MPAKKATFKPRGPDKKPRKRRSDAKKPPRDIKSKDKEYNPPVRDAQGKFVPGVSGNPYGRSRAIIPTQERIDKLAPLFPQFVEQLSSMMLSKDPKICLSALEIYRKCALPAPDNEQQAGNGVVDKLIIANIETAITMQNSLTINAPNVGSMDLPQIINNITDGENYD